MDEYAVITCPECRQKLRIPATASRLRVTCPACSLKFDYAPEQTDDVETSIAALSHAAASDRKAAIRKLRLVTGEWRDRVLVALQCAWYKETESDLKEELQEAHEGSRLHIQQS